MLKRIASLEKKKESYQKKTQAISNENKNQKKVKEYERIRVLLVLLY